MRSLNSFQWVLGQIMEDVRVSVTSECGAVLLHAGRTRN